MIDQKKFFECLHNEGVEFITGVPDSLLNEFCLYAQNELPCERHVIAANEGNAIALAAGYHLATGTIPLVYMQNSGLGNAVNPLLSLTNKEVYSIPLILLIGWRGEPGVKDHEHHRKQGELTPILLEKMDIPYRVIDKFDEEAFESAKWAVDTAKNISSPVALIAKKGMFEKGKVIKDEDDDKTHELSREKAIECVIQCLPSDAIFVATTGRATRELYFLREKYGMKHDLDFLNVGAMGHTSQIALGIALAKKDRLVVCLDGDGAAIMHLGGLTTVGKLKPANFLHIVLNNGSHESVGGQPTAGYDINFTGIAKNAGYKTIGEPVETERELKKAIQNLSLDNGPNFIDIQIRQGVRSDLGPLKVSLDSLKQLLKSHIMKI